MDNLAINLTSACSSATITVLFVHPIEVLKIRLQIKQHVQTSIPNILKNMYKQEGISSFWKGLKPAMIREGTYTTLRIGLYDPIKKYFGVTNQSPFYLKFFSGSLAGVCAVAVSNPFDILKTRMMASDKNLKITSLINEIYKFGKIKAFYSNLGVNVSRGMILNGTIMSTNDTVKQKLSSLNFTNNIVVINAISAFISGFVVTCVVNPFDVLRTRLMNQSLHTLEYKGIVDCATKMIKKEGIKSLYYGFFPLWFKFAPTSVLHFVFFEHFKFILTK